MLYFEGRLDVLKMYKPSQKKNIFISTALFFWILSFIRWETGTDWDSYLSFFEKCSKYEEFRDDGGFELFYASLSYLVKSITSDYSVFLFVIASIIFPLTYSTIYKFSPLPFVSLLLYLLLRRADIFFVRESIAIAFCLFSIRYIINRNLLQFVICVVIGMQFHTSVIIFLPAYWIFKMNIKTKYMIIAIGFFTVSAICLQDIIARYFSSLSIILGGSIEDRAEKYIERGFDSGGASSMAAALIQGSINRLIFFITFLSALKYKYNDIVYKGYLNLYFFSIIIFLLLTPFSLTLGRLVNSYEIISILLIGHVFSIKSIKNKNILFFVFFIYITIRFIVGTLFGVYSKEFVPYKTIFEI